MSVIVQPATVMYKCDRCGQTSEYSSFVAMKFIFPGRDQLGNICGEGMKCEICIYCERGLMDFIEGMMVPALS